MPTPTRERPELVRFLARDQVAQRSQEPAPRAEVTISGDASIAVLRIYDVIDSWGGWWGISAAEVAAALDEVPASITTTEVHLNSPGGEAREGVAIANLLRQHRTRVVAVVDGLAASAASMVAMGADEVVMAPSSQMMIHDASGGAWGPAAFLRQTANQLDHLSDSYAAAYAAKAGGDPADWRELMLAETWYSPDEAIAAGLADRLLPADAATDDPAAAFARNDLRVFAHAGRADAPAPKTPSATSAAGSTAMNRRTSVKLTDDQANALATRLGIADENADGDTLLAALDEALSEQTEPPAAPAATTTAVPPGAVLIESDVLASLRTDAAAGAAARKQQEADARAALVTAAIADGRISPARKDAWLAKLAADPGEADTLAQLEPGLTVPTTAIGHAGDGTDPATAQAVRETDAYKNWSL
jgi:ATP-dependent protease ClpP protease subunit